MFPIKTKWIISLTAWLIAWACLVSAEEKIIRGERIRAFLKNGELNLMGDFPEPKWSVLEERNLIKNGRWHPGSFSFPVQCR